MHVTHERVMDQFLGDQFLDVEAADMAEVREGFQDAAVQTRGDGQPDGQQGGVVA